MWAVWFRRNHLSGVLKSDPWQVLRMWRRCWRRRWAILPPCFGIPIFVRKWRTTDPTYPQTGVYSKWQVMSSSYWKWKWCGKAWFAEIQRSHVSKQYAEDLFIPSSLVLGHVMFSCWIPPATVFYGEAPRAQGQWVSKTSGFPLSQWPSQWYFWSTLVESWEQQQVANFPTSFVGYPAGFYGFFHIFVHVWEIRPCIFHFTNPIPHEMPLRNPVVARSMNRGSS